MNKASRWLSSSPSSNPLFTTPNFNSTGISRTQSPSTTKRTRADTQSLTIHRKRSKDDEYRAEIARDDELNRIHEKALELKEKELNLRQREIELEERKIHLDKER